MNGTVTEFARAHGVDASLEDIKAFLESQMLTEDEPLSADEMDIADSGTCNEKPKTKNIDC